MKFLKRAILTLLILTSILLLFRGWFYTHLVSYKSVGQRQINVIINKNLVDYIEMNTEAQKPPDIKDIIKLGLLSTSQLLKFSSSQNDVNPNKLVNLKKANCIGYASFFVSTCIYLLKKNKLADIWIVKHQIGQLYFMGFNIHKYFNSAFFMNHDFVTIENKNTGEIYAVDPTVNDYLYIDYVTYSK